MSISSYQDLAKMLKSFLEKIVKKLESESRQLEDEISSGDITLNLQNQLKAINDRINDIKTRTDGLDKIQRYGQKKN